jgi:hypothetical protein
MKRSPVQEQGIDVGERKGLNTGRDSIMKDFA